MTTNTAFSSICNILAGGKHTQKCGEAMYDDNQFFIFLPDYPMAGTVEPFHGMGMASLRSDGTFDFVRRPRLRTQSQLIRKLAHGRVSKTKDGAIQLTLKVFQDEGINISQAIHEEAELARQALVEWQMRR